MFHITSTVLGGAAALTAWALVAPGFDLATNANRSSHEYVNRAAKGDRLAPPVNVRRDNRTVATVEVIGVRDAAIVYRDRDGRVLFKTDPISNVTVITKDFVVPQLTVRDTPQSASKSIIAPIERDTRPATTPVALPPLPEGCEPLVSPIAEPQLARLPGRCIS